MRPILIFVFLLNVSGCLAQHEVFVKSDAAIQGYDPVAYFKESQPVKGKAALSYNWKQATWHFASQQNLDDFKSNPEKYAPQFGGYCAYGMAEGHKAPTSPDAWTILDAKLYLNYNQGVKELWDKDQRGNIEKAIKNWPTVKNDKD